MNNLNDFLTLASIGALSFAVVGAATMSILMLGSDRSRLNEQRHLMDQSTSADRSIGTPVQARPVVKPSMTPAANHGARNAA